MPEVGGDGRGAELQFVSVEDGATARPRPAAEIERLLAQGWAPGCDEPVLPAGWQLYVLDGRAIMRPVAIGRPVLQPADAAASDVVAVYPVVDLNRSLVLAVSLSHPAVTSTAACPAGRYPDSRTCAPRDPGSAHEQDNRPAQEG